MTDDAGQTQFVVSPELAGQTLAAALRQWMGELSWSHAKRMIVTRRVEINGALCLNDARRLNAGEMVVVLTQSRAPVAQSVRIHHIDPDLIVVDKPPGVVTIRRPEEFEFTEDRKEIQPTLDELVARMLPGAGPSRQRQQRSHRAKKSKAPMIHAVHRLDRDTSGVMMFALSVRARDALIDLFSRHEVRRTYWAAILGELRSPQTITSHLVRDRGDGLRGSSPRGAEDETAQLAVTHVRPVERLGSAITIVECRLETGRTHQIRIHLAEMGHMLCGEKLYVRPRPGAKATEDPTGAPRQALHSMDLHFTHPFTRQKLHFESTLPADLSAWLEKMRRTMG